MKDNIRFLLLFALVSTGFSQDEIDLKNQEATFTNLQGRVYKDVLLERGTLDGVVWSSKDASELGMVNYANLSPAFLASINIPSSRIGTAAQRTETMAEESQRYAAASVLAASQAQKDTTTSSNAVQQAQGQDATDGTTPATTASTTSPKAGKKKSGRH